MRDTMLASLVAARDLLCSAADTARVIADCVDRALDVQSPLERTFWIDSLASVLRACAAAQQPSLFAGAVPRIEATFVVTPRERHDAVRLLADRVVVLT